MIKKFSVGFLTATLFVMSIPMIANAEPPHAPQHQVPVAPKKARSAYRMRVPAKKYEAPKPAEPNEKKANSQANLNPK